MATKVAEKKEKTEAPADSQDGPLLDMSDQAVKRMIKAAKQRGFVTLDELNEVMPGMSSEQIEDILSMMSEMGINVVESEEEAEDQQEVAEAEGGTALPVKQEKAASEPVERTDDPVRMYLREMGSVELLSREGEIAIAKRIEAGREAMIAGLCESPLTFQAIIIWRDELNEGRILLRDIIDLEATYGGAPTPKPRRRLTGSEEAQEEEAKKDEPKEESGEATEAEDGEDEDDEEDDAENSLSLAAMEAELKPQVVDTFDRIASSYKKLRRLQDHLVEEQAQEFRAQPVAGAPLQEAAHRDYRRRQEPVRSTTTGSKRWSSSSTTSTSA